VVACKMSRRFNARSSTGETRNGSAGTANIMCRKFSV